MCGRQEYAKSIYLRSATVNGYFSPMTAPVPPDLPAIDPAVGAVERAMVRIRRNMARRTFARVLAERLGASVDLTHAWVVEAIAEGEESGDGSAPATVGVVGERLAIDPSRASRVVAAAVAAGYVARVATATDGRRIGLVLTAAGRSLAETTRAYRAAWLGEAMAGWSAEERRRFAELFGRFVDGLAQVGPDANG